MADELYNLSNFASAEDRKWLKRLNDSFPGPPGNLAIADTQEPTFSEDIVDVRDTSPSHLRAIQSTERTYELKAGIMDFQLYVSDDCVRLSWEGGDNISFDPESMHSTVFDHLSIITGNRDLISPRPDGLRQVNAVYRRKGGTAYTTINLENDEGQGNYQDLMSKLEEVAYIQYDVYDAVNRTLYLYSFGMQNRAQPWDPARMNLNFSPNERWTDRVMHWVLTNHRLVPSVIHPGIAPSLASKINELVAHPLQ